MLVSLLAAAAVAQAPAAPAKQCLAENRHACSVAQRAGDLTGIASAQSEADAGVEAYRAFFVDGYDNIRPVIAFERRPGEDPKVVVYFNGKTIETLASAASWRAVQEDGRFADRALADLAPPPRPPSEVPPPSVCLHPWTTSIEVINAPARGDTPELIRSRTESTCKGGLTAKFAYDMAALAVPQVPACDALDKTKHRNDIERLAFCMTLGGDRMAASGLANQIGQYFILRSDLAPRNAWQFWMGTNARPELNWAGHVTKDPQYGDRNVAGFLAAQESALDLSPSRLEGLDSRTVKVTGYMTRNSKAEAGKRERAPYEQTWVWDTAGRQWMLKTWAADAFTPVK